jgi:hypothetical protein
VKGEKTPIPVIHFLGKAANNLFPQDKNERRGKNDVSKMERVDGPHFLGHVFYLGSGFGC